MKKVFTWQLFKNVSIARTMYFTVIIMAVLITIELCALSFSINVLSAVRAYVGGEGLWSKAQKDAQNELLLYASTRNEEHYLKFNEYMKVLEGDGKTRTELAKPEPDMEIARQGFIQGRNHPDDVDGMLKLFLRFNGISYIQRAIVAWSKAEPIAMELKPIAEKLHAEINSPDPSVEDISALVGATKDINLRVTKWEDEFSFALGEGARWLEGLVLKLLFAIALTVEFTGILLAISVSRKLQKGLTEIINAAKAFAAGNLSARAKVFSQDEIGVVAENFNQMSDKLQQNMAEQLMAQRISGELLDSLQKSEAEIRALNESLEKKVAERTAQLEDANRGLEAFSYTVSHDLRTPLRSINGFSKLLIKNYPNIDDDSKEYLNLISENALRMNHIIDGLLKLARYDRSQLVKQDVDMRKLVTKIIDDVKLGDKELKAEIIVEELKPAQCDPVLIEQVYANLISNAIKYSRKKDSPKIEIGHAYHEGSNIYYVKDNGAGFDMQYSDQLFGAFKRLHKAEEFEGTGVGLALVHRVVTRHGGKIWAEAKVGEGATFYFSLPSES